MANPGADHDGAGLLIRRIAVCSLPAVLACLWLLICSIWLEKAERGPFRVLSRLYRLPVSNGLANFEVAPQLVPWAKMVALAGLYGPSVHVMAFGMRFRLPVASGTLQIGWPAKSRFPQYPKTVRVTWSGTKSSWPLHKVSPFNWRRPEAAVRFRTFAFNGSERLPPRHWLMADHLLYVSVPKSPGRLKIFATGDPVPPRCFAVGQTNPHTNTTVMGIWPATSPPWAWVVSRSQRGLAALQSRMTRILERAGSDPWTSVSESATAMKLADRMTAEQLFTTAASLSTTPGPGSRYVQIASVLMAFPEGGPYFSKIVKCAGRDGTLYILKLSGRHGMWVMPIAEGYAEWRWLFFGPKGNCLSFGDVSCRKVSSTSRAIAKVAAVAGFVRGIPKPLPSRWGSSFPRGTFFSFVF